METKDNPTDPSLAGGAHVTSTDGGAAVDSSTLTLAELKQFLGKDFKDKDSALKALKDTQSYVGKKKEDIEAEVRASLSQTTPPAQSSPADSALASTVKSLEDRLFFTDHPELKDYADVIKAMGTNPAEVVETAAFKKVFEQGKVANEVATTRSVVNSNPRLAQSNTVTQDAVKMANTRGATQEDVATILARGIIAETNEQ